MFNVNQIVKGKFAGTFVILGFRANGDAQLKEVNPNDHSQVARGELSLPVSALVAL